MKKPKSSTGSQRTSVRGCENTWNFLYRVLNISLTFLQIHVKYQHQYQPPRRQGQQGSCSMSVLVDHSCHRGTQQSGKYQRREERGCVSSKPSWLHGPQPLEGTKGRAGKVQHYLSGSPMWKGAGSTWLLVAKWLERSSVEKDLLQVLLDTTLTMTKQCALTAKTVRSLLGADHSPPLSTDEPQLEPKAQCWAPSTRQSCCEFSFCFA